MIMKDLHTQGIITESSVFQCENVMIVHFDTYVQVMKPYFGHIKYADRQKIWEYEFTLILN